MLVRVWSVFLLGIDVIKVGVEVDVFVGFLAIVVVGLLDMVVQEFREWVKVVLKNVGFVFFVWCIVINFILVDLCKEGFSFDLFIGIGILVVLEQVDV